MKNSVFYKNKEELKVIKHNTVVYLKIKKFNNLQIVCFKEAFDYFVKFPDKYDGGTLTQDLYDVDKIEVGVVIHDYLYNIGAWASKDLLKKSDIILKNIMRKTNKSGFEIKWRMIRLFILREVLNYAWINRNFRNKKVNDRSLKIINTTYKIF